MAVAYLSLGSNQGDSLNQLKMALQYLEETPEIHLTGVSSIYETTPVGPVEQHNFLNLAAAIQTNLSPEALLHATQDVESRLHRKRLIRWGPRTMDIDIITYEDLTITSEFLTLPHPEALNRAFVLVPLAEITPEDYTIAGKKIREVLKRTPPDPNSIWLFQETLPF